jgi:hypothetical protein
MNHDYIFELAPAELRQIMAVSGAGPLLRPPAWVFITFDLDGRKGAERYSSGKEGVIIRVSCQVIT